jgi:hypothetical protein
MNLAPSIAQNPHVWLSTGGVNDSRWILNQRDIEDCAALGAFVTTVNQAHGGPPRRAGRSPDNRSADGRILRRRNDVNAVGHRTSSRLRTTAEPAHILPAVERLCERQIGRYGAARKLSRYELVAGLRVAIVSNLLPSSYA